MKTMQMQSCVHENATVECTLIEIELPEPGPDDVVVEIEAAPINPSDLGLMFGAADLSTVRALERDGQPSVLLDVPDAAMRAMAPRIGHAPQRRFLRRCRSPSPLRTRLWCGGPRVVRAAGRHRARHSHRPPNVRSIRRTRKGSARGVAG